MRCFSAGNNRLVGKTVRYFVIVGGVMIGIAQRIS
jgi:hypothetical protein